MVLPAAQIGVAVGNLVGVKTEVGKLVGVRRLVGCNVGLELGGTDTNISPFPLVTAANIDPELLEVTLAQLPWGADVCDQLIPSKYKFHK